MYPALLAASLPVVLGTHGNFNTSNLETFAVEILDNLENDRPCTTAEAGSGF
jgi:hypothetical protein